jgi:hypothetical protein
MRSQNDFLQEIVRKYKADGNEWPATTREMAQWAVDSGLWAPQPSAIVGQCADQLGRAMRDEFILDPQGRKVRALHSAVFGAGSEQHSFWDDIRTATPRFMQVAFQGRRRQIVGDCRQLKNDVDSYNENRRPACPVQIVFDFRDDLREIELARGQA